MHSAPLLVISRNIYLQKDMNESIIAIWVSGTIFAAIHSFMASLRCKRWFAELGLTPQQYRLGYTLLALLLAAVWLLFVRMLPDKPFYAVEGSLRWLLVGLQLIGLVIALLSLRYVDTPAFLGLRSFANHIEPFREQGIYRHIRHPMYSGVMAALMAMPLQSQNSFHFTLVVCLYFMIGARFEERRMLNMHPDYADYRRRVSAFIPWRTLFPHHGRPE